MKSLLIRAVAALLIPCLAPTAGARGLQRRCLTVEDLRRHFPRARLTAVSEEGFHAAREQFEGRSLVLVDLIEEPCVADPADGAPPPPSEAEGAKEPPCGTETGAAPVPETAAPVPETPAEPSEAQPEASPPEPVLPASNGPEFPGGSCLMNWSGGGGRGAEVLFVIVGVAVVAVLVVYAPVFLYQAATSGAKEYWWDAGLASAFLVGEESGTLAGVKVQGGLAHRGLHMGLAAEVGRMDLRLELDEEKEPKGTRRTRVGGTYGLLGPAIRVSVPDPRHPGHVFLELLAGTSSRRLTGMMSVARAGLNAEVYERLSLGLSVGALYTHLKETEGLIRKNEFDFLLGVEAGYRF